MNYFLFHHYSLISKSCSILSFVLLSAFGFNANAQWVSTYAGTGVSGSANGTTSTCQFAGPEQMAYDSNGNLYVADHQNNVVKKINPSGIVTTFAGTGVAGFVDGDVSIAQLNNPIGLAIDAMDNVYIADNGNFVIRKVDTDGNVSTYAGTGTEGYVDGDLATAQFAAINYMCFDDSMNLYVADPANNCIRMIDTLQNVTTFSGGQGMGFDDGSATTATFNGPMSIAFNSHRQSFYVSDQSNSAIRKLSMNGDVTTIAGTGTAGHANGSGNIAMFDFPKGLTTDSIGNIYVAGRLDFCIRKIDTLYNVTTVAGVPYEAGYDDNIEGEFATFGRPISVVMNGDNEVLISDWSNHVIRKLDLTNSTGINDRSAQFHAVKVYPNPSRGLFSVMFEEVQTELSYRVLTITGRVILSSSVNNATRFELELNEAPGVYLLELTDSSNNSSVLKLIKE